MKKSFYVGLIALTTVAFASCSQDEQVSLPQGADNAIEFATYSGRAPQGAPGKRYAPVLTDTELKAQGFGVYASYTKDADWETSDIPNFMFNQEVKYDNGNSKWDYSPKKYWPKTAGPAQKISFFAYGPYVDIDGNPAVAEKSTNADSGTPVVTYTLSSDADKVVDFVAAVMMNESRTSRDEDANAVKFELKHELTRMNFQGKLDRDAWTGTAPYLTQVNITDVKIEAEGEFYSVADYKFSVDETTRGSWTGITPATTDWTVTTQLAKITPAVDLGGYTTQGVQLPNQTAVDLFNGGSYIYLIPTWGEGGIAANDIKVTFTYDLVTKDAELAAGHVVSTATKTVSLPAGTLAQGKAYNFIFTFGLTEVKVSASVLPWEDGGDSNADVNYGNPDA